jgi:hypothetical protein
VSVRLRAIARACGFFDPLACAIHRKIVWLEIGARQRGQHFVDCTGEDRLQSATTPAVVVLMVEPSQKACSPEISLKRDRPLST